MADHEGAKMINEIQHQHEQTRCRYKELSAGVQASVDLLINTLASSPSQAESAAVLAVDSARRQMLAQDQYALLADGD
jgi:hypothetical protein